MSQNYAFHYAASKGDIDIFKQTLHNVIDKLGCAPINFPDPLGVLHHPPLVLPPVLLNALETEGPYGNSPLHWACNQRRWDIINLMLGLGADPYKTNQKGVCPLQQMIRRMNETWVHQADEPVIDYLLTQHPISENVDVQTRVLMELLIWAKKEDVKLIHSQAAKYLRHIIGDAAPIVILKGQPLISEVRMLLESYQTKQQLQDLVQTHQEDTQISKISEPGHNQKKRL